MGLLLPEAQGVQDRLELFSQDGWHAIEKTGEIPDIFRNRSSEWYLVENSFGQRGIIVVPTWHEAIEYYVLQEIQLVLGVDAIPAKPILELIAPS
jgi:hypothetical protein